MIIWILIVIGIIAIDQVTKILAYSYLRPIGSIPLINDVLHLTYVENKGAAFGMLSDQRWIFMTISSIAIVALIIYIIKCPPSSMIGTVAISFLIGGGIGNMIDRILRGFVVDFVDVRLINFYVFNAADSFVSIGGVLLIMYVIISEKRSKDKKALPGNDNENNTNH